MKRLLVVSVVSAYLGAGLFAGLLMQRAIPAINPVGVLFIAITWPNQLRCAREASGCQGVPTWAARYVFSFPEEARYER